MTSIERYLNTIKKLLTFPSVSSKVNISANSIVTYHISNYTNNVAEIDVLATDIKVLIKDTDSLSSTNGLYINSEAVISVGIDESRGAVIIRNHSSLALECHVTIRLKRKE